MLPKTSRTLLAVALAAGAGAALTPAAEAAYPGENGQIVYAKHAGGSTYQLHLVDPDGTDDRPLTDTELGADLHPVWSPDGKAIAYQHSHSEGTELRIVDPQTGTSVPLGGGTAPTWSPDGTKIAYALAGDIWVRSSDPDAVAEPVLLTPGPGYDTSPAWSAKDQIAFIRRENGNDNVWVMPATGDVDGAASPVSRDVQDEASPDWSPDGTKLAYVRTDDGGDVFVQELHHPAKALHPLGSAVDADPVWAPDGSRVLWRSSRAWNELPGTRLWTADPAAQQALPLIVGAGVPEGDGVLGVQPDWQPLAPSEEPHDEEPHDEDPQGGEGPKEDETPRGDQQPPAQQPGPPAPTAPQQPQPQQQQPDGTPRTTVVTSKSCVSRRRFTITLPSRGKAVRSATVTLDGRPLPVTVGTRGRAVVDLRRKPKGTFTVKIAVETAAGTVKQTRRYRTCTPKRRA